MAKRSHGIHVRRMTQKDRVVRQEHWERTGHKPSAPKRRGFEHHVTREKMTITQARKAIRKRIAEAWDKVKN